MKNFIIAGLALLALLVVLFFAAPIYAGSYVYVGDGTPYKWKDGVIKVYIDPDKLSANTSNEDARKMIVNAWKTWEDAKLHLATIEDTVLVSGIHFVDMGPVPGVEDINEKNYKKYWCVEDDSEKCPDAFDKARPTVIIFDKDGAIMKDLVVEGFIADGQDDDVLGMTDLYAKDDSGKYILNGTIILNGAYWEATSDKAAFEAAVRHELGHLMNLDHSSINDNCYNDQNCAGDMDGWQYLPTMFRYPLSASQNNLHMDDIVWAAYLYKNQDNNILDKFCSVWGHIYDKEGRGFQGAEVVAYEVGGPDKAQSQSVAAITGSFYKACAEDGTYFLTGLRPGKTYKIKYGHIPDWCGGDHPCSLASGINPYAPPRPLDEEGEIHHETGYDFVCEEGGTKTKAVYVKLKASLDDEKFQAADNISPYICKPGEGLVIPEPPEPETTSPAGLPISKKGWCSLVVGGQLSLGIIWALLPLCFFVAARKRLKIKK